MKMMEIYSAFKAIIMVQILLSPSGYLRELTNTPLMKFKMRSSK